VTSTGKQALCPERSEEGIATGIGRRVFSQALTGSVALLLVHGCGGGDGGTAAPSGTCGASGTAISLNHGHVLVIPLMDLDSMVAMTYSIRGSADHDHTVTFEVAQLRQLKAGASVTVDASVQAAHIHVVTLACVP
jgi:hypothetical protein